MLISPFVNAGSGRARLFSFYGCRHRRACPGRTSCSGASDWPTCVHRPPSTTVSFTMPQPPPSELTSTLPSDHAQPSVVPSTRAEPAPSSTSDPSPSLNPPDQGPLSLSESPCLPDSQTSTTLTLAATDSPASAAPPTRKGPKGARHLQPKPAVKCGRKSSWPPKKLAWLESHLPQFLACTTADSAKFYDRIVFIWYKLFDRSLPIRQDPEGDIDEATALEKEDSIEQLTEDEINSRIREEHSLRSVSTSNHPSLSKD